MRGSEGMVEYGKKGLGGSGVQKGGREGEKEKVRQREKGRRRSWGTAGR